MRAKKSMPVPVVKTSEQIAEEKLTSDRKRFVKALNNGRTYTEAHAITRDIIVAANIRGMKSLNDSTFGGGLSLEFERGWTIGCRLSIRFDLDYDSRVTNPDNTKQAVTFFKPVIDLTWSSTGRTVAAATASLALYREVIELAAELEAVLNESAIRKYRDLEAAREMEDVQPTCTCGKMFGQPVNEYGLCRTCKRDAQHDAARLEDNVRTDVKATLKLSSNVTRGSNDEACNSCGCLPGDGRTEGCKDPDGCGYYATEDVKA